MSKQEVDLEVVNGKGDGGVQYGAQLMKFAEAVASDTNENESADTLREARDALFNAAGNDVLVDAAAVAANFQRMVRIADSTGIPVDGIMEALSSSIQENLDLRRFESSRNTPTRTAWQKFLGMGVKTLARTVVRAGNYRAQRSNGDE